ncbi:VanZ family protein [Paenibacillus doosanensis]|nr:MULTISPECIES: VanZ family protein [Paenibacillus]MCS7461037.1 VanZ family protein [Paenibacillus doosanensis]
MTAMQTFTGEHTKLIIQRYIGNMTEDHLYWANSFVRKGAHVVAFGLLALVFYKAIRKRTIGYALCCTLLAAMLDEWHQSFVPDRSASFRDVMLDTLAGLLFLLGAAKFRGRNEKAKDGIMTKSS